MKPMEKLLCLALAVVLVLSLSVSALAAPIDSTTTGSLVIHSSRLTGTAHIDVYLMFEANGESNASSALLGADAAVSYTLNKKWDDFFWMPGDKTEYAAIATDASGAPVYPVDLSELKAKYPNLDRSSLAQLYLRELYEKGEANLVAFAQTATVYALSATKAGGVTGPTKTLPWTNTEASSKQGSIDGLRAGYYLVDVVGQNADDMNRRGSDAMLVNIPTDNPTELWLKNERPTVRKLVKDPDQSLGEDADYEIGDDVPFQVTVQVPDFRAYQHYTFIFTDTLSVGLDFNVKSVKATIPAPTAEASDATRELTLDVKGPFPAEDPNKTYVTIEVVDFMEQLTAEDIGKTITLTYTAKLNDDAEWDFSGNNNQIYLTYSNDPFWDGNGEEPTDTTLEDTAYVFTFDILIDKYWEQTVAGQADPEGRTLAGVTFKLYDVDPRVNPNAESMTLYKLSDTLYHVHDNVPADNLHEDECLSFVTIDDGERSTEATGSTDATFGGASGGEAVVDADDDATGAGSAGSSENVGDGAVHPVTGREANYIQIAGLKEGTYYLVETDVPYGYNKLADPIVIKISYTLRAGTEELGDVIYHVNGEQTDNHNILHIKNSKGAILPETGGIGTISLTACGLTLAFLGCKPPRKKKT